MTTFCVLAHREPALLARLLRRLDGHRAVVHLDLRANIDDFRSAVAGIPNVSFVPLEKRVRVKWAGFSMIEATLNLMSVGATVTPRDEHLVLISGQCYPARPINEFVDMLDSTAPRQHIRRFEIGDSSDHYRKQIARRFYFDYEAFGGSQTFWTRTLRKLLYVANRPRTLKVPAGVRPSFGSQWIALTVDCYLELDDFLRTHPEVRKFFSRVFAPDEKFFHSLVASPPLSNRGDAGDPEPFLDRGTWRMANFHYIDASLSHIFTLSDLDRIVHSGQFFVRKVSLPTSKELLDILDSTSGMHVH